MTARVFHFELWGKRSDKYDWLAEHSVEDTKWAKLDPAAPLYLFRPYNVDAAEVYHQWPAITAIMPINVTGVVTARDHFVIDIDRNALLARMREFRSDKLSDEALRGKYFAGKGSSKYPAGDSRGWKLPKAREKVREDKKWDKCISPILYRPFDERFIYYVPWMADWPRTEAMPHLLAGENLALTTTRQTKDQWDVFVTSTIMGHKGCSRFDIGSVFPLYLYPNVGKVDQRMFEQWPEGKGGRRPNLDPGFVHDLAERIGLEFIPDGCGDLSTTFGPEDVLHYIYAVFHCPTYRKRYAEFLKLDFPRVPPTGDRKLFVRLCMLGAELTALHLLEAESLTGRSVGYPVAGTDTVEKGYPKYVPPGEAVVQAGKNSLKSDKRLGRVYINPVQFFEGVEPAVWGFQIGGYQVAEKWLKDRRERKLAHDDISRYTKVVEALRGTIRLMAAIDEAIPDWPMQ